MLAAFNSKFRSDEHDPWTDCRRCPAAISTHCLRLSVLVQPSIIWPAPLGRGRACLAAQLVHLPLSAFASSLPGLLAPPGPISCAADGAGAAET